MGESGAQYEDDWEDDTAADYLDGLTVRNSSLTSSQFHSSGATVYPTSDDEPVVMSSRVDGPRDMFGEEIVVLVRNTVETTRRALHNSLANSNLTEDVAAQSKLTIQLKSQGFREFPEKAIELLKPDVERLVIAHNAIPLIPYKFSELQGLTFLNIRSNRLREFPKAFLKLTRLQMLDISNNQLSKIPDEITQMKSMKVLSASRNNLESIPTSLGFLEALRILKVDSNPLNKHFRRIVDEAGGFPRESSHPPHQTQQELDTTTKIKMLLRREVSNSESTGESSESPLETPRPLRRNNSLRFPVAIPGLSGSEHTPDLTSPSSLREKTHQRVTSGTSGSGTYQGQRRPGIAPLLINSDRNRSNSDGVPQATQTLRTKRIGLLSKKQQELSVDPDRLSKSSLHLRGVSHGSALKDRSTSGRHVGRSNLSNGSSISDADHPGHAELVVRRLSSLPEADIPDLPDEIQACKGLLYSLHQMHVVIGNQYNIVRQGTPKRSSLERVYYNATSHLDNLDHSLYNLCNAAEEDDNVKELAYRATREGSKSCIVAYKQVIELVYRGSDHYVSQTDPRFVRTFLHMLYASITEAVNATASLRKTLDETQPTSTIRNAPAYSPKGIAPKLTVRGTTPIKEKPRNITTRLRNDTLGGLHSSSTRYKSSSNPYSSVPLYVNNRSRSNSRNLSSGQPTTFSPVNITPQSSSSFNPMSPGLPTPAQDYNPIHTADFNNTDIHFEQVHYAYVQAVNACNGIILDVYQRFRNHQKVLIETSAPRARQDAQSRLAYRAKYCQDQTEALKGRLSAVKLKDPEVRRSAEFWRHCTRFLNSFIKLVDDVKATSVQFGLDGQIVRILKPVHLAVKSAVMITKNSPWAYVLDQPSPSHSSSRMGSVAGSPAHSRAPSKDTPTSAYSNHSAHPSGTIMPADRLRAANANAGSVSLSARGRGDSETSLSPYLPQTPLSAALGPAAQATIPSTLAANVQPGTPPKSSLDTSFRGDVFERADTLLRSHSVIGHRR